MRRCAVIVSALLAGVVSSAAVRGQLPAGGGARLARAEGFRIRHLDYDWSLNEQKTGEP
jgi:hypothetical protein